MKKFLIESGNKQKPCESPSGQLLNQPAPIRALGALKISRPVKGHLFISGPVAVSGKFRLHFHPEQIRARIGKNQAKTMMARGALRNKHSLTLHCGNIPILFQIVQDMTERGTTGIKTIHKTVIRGKCLSRLQYAAANFLFQYFFHLLTLHASN